jgi:molybdate transport system permease protein
MVELLSPAEWTAIRLSLVVGFWSVLGSFIPGIFFGWLLARKNFIGKSMLEALIHLPMVVPPVATGFILLMLFGRSGILGVPLAAIGISFSFSTKGAALASAVTSFPLMVRAIRISMEGVDTSLEQAARTLGACRVRVFFTVTLPLSISGIIGGIVMAFARSLGEFGATITFVSNIPGITRTIPLAMYSSLQIPGNEAAAARLTVISLAIAFAALVASEYFTRKNRIKNR